MTEIKMKLNDLKDLLLEQRDITANHICTLQENDRSDNANIRNKAKSSKFPKDIYTLIKYGL